MTMTIQSDERLPRLLNPRCIHWKDSQSEGERLGSGSWATFPDPLSFPAGTDKKSSRKKRYGLFLYLSCV